MWLLLHARTYAGGQGRHEEIYVLKDEGPDRRNADNRIVFF
jgi:hypothetical protein